MISVKGCPELILLLSLGNTVVEAREWFVEPTSNLRTEFDDNIRLQTNGQSDAYGFVASLAAKSGMRTELLNVALTTGVDIYQYWGQKNLDRENFNLGLQTDYSVNENNKFGLALDYIRDTSLTSEQGGTGFLGGALQNIQIGRERVNVAPSWSYLLSDSQILKITYAHEDVSYEKNKTSFLYSYLTDSGELSYTQQWSPAWQYFISLGAMRYEAQDISTIIDNYSINFGADYKYSETLSFNFMIGGRDTESENGSRFQYYQRGDIIYEQPTPVTSSSNLGSLFSLGMKRQFEVGTLVLNYSRNTSPTAGGIVQQSDSINASVEHKFTEQLTLMLSGSADFYSSTSSAITSYNRDYYLIEPKLGWMLNKQLNLIGGYHYIVQQYDTSNIAATSNAFFVYLNYQWDKLASNQF